METNKVLIMLAALVLGAVATAGIDVLTGINSKLNEVPAATRIVHTVALMLWGAGIATLLNWLKG